MASPRLLAPSGGAGPGVGGTGPGMTVAVTDRTTARPVGRVGFARPEGTDRSARGTDGQFVRVRRRGGVVASHSRGQGTYTPPTAPGGAVASTLTALHPYAGYDVNARTSVWGVVGYGVGEVSLTPARATTARETDLTNTMAAVGGRAALSVRSGRAGRFELALRSDARLTNTAADAVAGLLGATERTRLVRMMLEGAGVVPLALGGVLTPTVEAGLRYDTGVESGGGSRQALRLGVTLTAGRRLDAGLELGQRQGAPGADPEHAAQLRATLRW